MNNIQDILMELGYELSPDKDGWRSSCIFRGGDNKTALKIFNNGQWIDFVEGQKGNLEDLIKLTLGEKVNPKEWLNGKIDISVLKENKKPKIKLPEIFDEEVLCDLVSDFSYWEQRDISQDTSKLFKGGLCMGSQGYLGKLKNRQVLCIYDSKDKLVGFTGRDVTNKHSIKWKHLGDKSNWVWPAYLNTKIIKETKEIILVESPADILKMWQCDIKNVICLFGTECSHAILNYLLKRNLDKIIISTNNEESGVGNRAADKVYNKLKRYFNHNQLLIKLPYKKDFCEQTCDSIRDWYNERYK